MNAFRRYVAASAFFAASVAYACASDSIGKDPSTGGASGPAGASGAAAGGATGGSAADGQAGSGGTAGGGAGAGGAAGGATGGATGGTAGAAHATACAAGERRCRGACVAVGTCEVRERLYEDRVLLELEPALPPKHRLGGDGDGRAAQFALVDYDGDAYLDLVWATYAKSIGGPPNADAPELRFRIALARGTGPCSFDLANSIRLAEREYGLSTGFTGLWPVDIDRDGHGDLVTLTRSVDAAGNTTSSFVSLFFRGDGTFRTAEAELPQFVPSQVFGVGRPTDDGFAVACNPEGDGTQVALVDAKGGIKGVLPSPNKAGAVRRWYDVDGDGRDEAILGGFGPGTVGGTFALSEGQWLQVTTTLTDPVPPSTKPRVPGQYRADIDGDGHADLGDGGGLLSLFRGGGNFEYLPWPKELDGIVRLEDLDGDGLADGDRYEGDTFIGLGDGSFIGGPPAMTVTGAVLLYSSFTDVDGDGGKEGLFLSGPTLSCYHHVGGVVLK